MKKLLSLVSLSFVCLNLHASVTEKEFDLVARKFENFATTLGKVVIPDYKKTIKLHKDKLNFEASATEPMQINLGLINSRYMTLDAVVLIMCHEIGHDLKIARFYTPLNLSYSFSHLEQDYFATYACMMPFLKSSFRTSRTTEAQIINDLPIGLQTRCATNFQDQKDVGYCLRTIHASVTAINSLYEEVFKESYKKKLLPKPSLDREWLGKTDDLQARLITLVNGVFRDLPFHRWQ